MFKVFIDETFPPHMQHTDISSILSAHLLLPSFATFSQPFITFMFQLAFNSFGSMQPFDSDSYWLTFGHQQLGSWLFCNLAFRQPIDTDLLANLQIFVVFSYLFDSFSCWLAFCNLAFRQPFDTDSCWLVFGHLSFLLVVCQFQVLVSFVQISF